MSNVFERVTVRNNLAEWRAETPSRFYQGDDEMSFVALVKINDVSFAALVEALIVAAGGGVNNGYLLAAGGGANTFFLSVGTGAAVPIGTSRLFTAKDVGTVARIVGVSSVAANAITVYVNGRDDGTPAALSAYSPPSPASGGAVCVDDGGGGAGNLVSMELIEIAAVSVAFTAEQITQLDQSILASGQIPSNFAPWQVLFRAENLVGHPLVGDMGGLNAGRGLICRNGSALGSPILSSCHTIWGGDGQ